VAEAEDSAWTQYVAPLSHANCPWYGVEQVDEWLTEARAFPDSYEQRINGAWEGTTQSRTFTGFDSSCLITEDDPQPKGCKIGVGLDHGEHAGSQVAVLVAWNASGIWVLDEAVSKSATTPAQDAVAIREMLLANGLDVHMVDAWIGDVNSVGKLGAGYKVNEILGLALAREAGHARQGFKINTPQKGAGSVDIGEKLTVGQYGEGLIHGRLQGHQADHAEWMPRHDPGEVLMPGDVVALTRDADGTQIKVSKRAMGFVDSADVEWVVVPTNPQILGHQPPPGEEHLHVPIVFMGQVPVRVEGSPRASRYLMPSDRLCVCR
jgi:hypothetical protein